MSVPRALGRAQTVIAETFTATAQVERKIRTSDSAGGAVETWSTVASYPCSFEEYQVRPVERENTARPQALGDWSFAFPFDADVRTTDRLLVGTRRFEVSGVGTGSLATMLRVFAMEIR